MNGKFEFFFSLLWRLLINNIPFKHTSGHKKFLLFISVLPDLRSGGGFTFVGWFHPATFDQVKKQTILVDGMSQVSGSLDEEDAEDITKGIVIQNIKNQPK